MKIYNKINFDLIFYFNFVWIHWNFILCLNFFFRTLFFFFEFTQNTAQFKEKKKKNPPKIEKKNFFFLFFFWLLSKFQEIGQFTICFQILFLEKKFYFLVELVFISFSFRNFLFWKENFSELQPLKVARQSTFSIFLIHELYFFFKKKFGKIHSKSKEFPSIFWNCKGFFFYWKIIKKNKK